MRWTVVIPAKALPQAKSRLLPATADPIGHRRLVEAIRTDTLVAARAADGVARVLVVVDRPAEPDAGRPVGTQVGTQILVQSVPGLNGALGEAAAHAAHSWPEDGVAALVGDLPALRSAELAEALAAAAAGSRSFVPDAAGTGTTLLAVTPGTPLLPRFGAGSAARHREVAVELRAGAGLRHDVDTAEDLRAAAGLTLGPETAAVLGDSGAIAASP